ncbi:MAG: phage terminase large subunit [Acidobacteriota bacterium]
MAASRSALECARLAKLAGVPRDSLERFLQAGYVPQPRQLDFHGAARECDLADGPTDIGFGGVRGESKTHSAVAQIALDDCIRVPGLKVLWLRLVGKAARESFSDLRKKIFSGVDHNYKAQSGVIEYSNGSTIILGHFKNEKDIDNYLGLEYDLILSEEATQLTERKHQDILTCRRTSKPNWRPRSYYTFNPGGVGHAYIYRIFYLPFKNNCETDTRFIWAQRGDNRFLDANYSKNLDKLTGWKRKAWRDGDMEIAAGQFFTTWRHEVHVKHLDPLPRHWTVWCAMDYGFTHPTVVYLFAKHDGKIYVVDEHYAAKKLPKWHAPQILAMLARHGVKLGRLAGFVAGADVFSQKGDEEGKTIADQYAGLGIDLTPARMDRISGWGEVLDCLGDIEMGIAPKLIISDRCGHLIECIPALQHDPRRPEDVLKVDVDEDGNGGDDPGDCLRYGLMFQPVPVIQGTLAQGSARGW